jgi:hypothetical protein
VNRRLAIPVAVAALVAAAGGAAWAVAGADSESGTGSTSTASATATVERRNLVQYETVDGTLGYADQRSLYAQRGGTVTALRQPGRVAGRGDALYWLDARPVTLFYGSLPLWRRLDASSADGEDIRQLERNLVALGYDPYGAVDVDDEWDSATTAAVKRWQEDLGLAETGVVDVGDVVFLPGPRRIGEQKTTVGALLQPGVEVMETSSTRRIVTVDLEADQQALVQQGDAVSVEIPNGSTIRGRITRVSKVAESALDPQTGEETDPTIELRITLSRGSKTGRFDEAPVDVSLEKETAKRVLTIPVNALLALAEGGFAVEVVNANGTTRLVRVEPGMYADSFVEIKGNGLEDGTKVAVPA